MDPTAQQVSQSQQQARPMTEPAVREPVAPQPPVTPSKPSVPSSVNQISIGREQGPIQISSDDEDDVAGGQQYTSQTPQQDQSETVRQPSAETIVTQAVPQEIAQSSTEVMGPAVPEIEIPQELKSIVTRTPDAQNYSIPASLQNYGVKHTIPQVAVPENKYQIHTLPLPYEEVVAKEKAFQYKDSMKWLSAKVHYFWRKINPSVYK